MPQEKKITYPISLINLDAKVLTKVLANLIQQYIKRTKWDLFQGCKNVSTSANQCAILQKNNHIIINTCRKNILQNSICFHGKNSTKWVKRDLSQHKNPCMASPLLTSLLNSEKIKALFLRSGRIQKCSCLSFNIVLEVLSSNQRR